MMRHLVFAAARVIRCLGLCGGCAAAMFLAGFAGWCAWEGDSWSVMSVVVMVCCVAAGTLYKWAYEDALEARAEFICYREGYDA